eukprot:GHVQ01017697.1.p1 GENE.GHVQ01017697.1~~GHVQ01017697.1.p1  ORF type:complete len:1046 (-),score=118.02 GHVQ01017697.1:976-4113(-)
MWLSMCISEEGHLRVATLKQHILRNNDFTKLFVNQHNVQERMSALQRLFNFILSISSIFAVAAYASTFSMPSLSDNLLARNHCLSGCLRLHFPHNDRCREETTIRLLYKGNLYTRFYRFPLNTSETSSVCPADSDEASCAFTSPSVSSTSSSSSSSFPIHDHHVAALPFASLVSTSTTPLVTSAPPSSRKSSVFSTCLSLAKDPSAALWTNYYMSYATLTLNDPDLPASYAEACQKYPNSSYCTPPEARLHTCFLPCRTLSDAAEQGGGFEEDNRPQCGSELDERELLCVYPDDAENVFLDGLMDPVCFDQLAQGYASPREKCVASGGQPSFSGAQRTDSDKRKAKGATTEQKICPRWCFSWIHVLVAILISNPIQLACEMVLMLIKSLPDEWIIEACCQKTRKCMATLFLAGVLVLNFSLATYAFLIAIPTAYLGVIFTTFFVALIVDQLKNIFLVQPLVWFIVITRLGTLRPQQVYCQDYHNIREPQPSLLTQLRTGSMFCLELPIVQKALLGVLIIYTCFVIFLFLFVDESTRVRLVTIPDLDYADLLCQRIDLGFLTFFMLELAVKVFTYGLAYFADVLSTVDAVIVTVSFALLARGTDVQGLGILRILRLLRAVAAMRQLSRGRKRLRNIRSSGSSGLEASSQVEKVWDIIDDLQRNSNVMPYLRDELDWALEMILSNKLYESSVGASGGGAAAGGGSVSTGGIGGSVAGGAKDGGKGGGMSGTAMVEAWLMGFTAGNSASSDSPPALMAADTLSHTADITSLACSARAPATSSASIFFPRETYRRSSLAAKKSRTRLSAAAGNQFSSAMDSMLSFVEFATMIEASGISEAEMFDSMKGFDDWQWDVFRAYDVLGPSLLPVTFGKAISQYELVTRYRMNTQKMIDFIRQVQRSFVKTEMFGNLDDTSGATSDSAGVVESDQTLQEPYSEKGTKGRWFHGPVHAADMIQCIHFILGNKGARVAQHIGDLEVFTEYLGALVCHFGHTGFTNQFMVKNRHPRAIRYNDMSVMENYACAAVCNLLNDPSYQFLGELVYLGMLTV